MTNLKEYKDHFVEELSSLYSGNEAESLFFIFLHEWAGISKLEYLSHSREKIYDDTRSKLDEVCRQLLTGKPFQYLLGYVSFASLHLKVNSAVLIPRPETEELAWMIKRDLQLVKPASVLDVGCGSGCLALSMKSFYPGAEVLALEYSPEALEVATGNAKDNRLEVRFTKADFLDASQRPRNKFDLIVSNPPYIAESEKAGMDRVVVDYDPHQALFVEDEDPLVFYRAIAEYAGKHLNKDGKVYVEINERLGEATCEVFRSAGFEAELRKDLYNKDRFVVAGWSDQP